MSNPADVGIGPTLTAPPSTERTIPADLLDRGLPTVDDAHYRRDREIARGGLGKITAAVDLRVGRPVALKEVLDPSGLAADRYPRFLREAVITARLQHPSIVPVYEIGVWPSGAPFFAMKLVDGRPLSQVIEEGALTERLARIGHVIAVADAIAYAHARGVIHRDLKPANVLCGAFGETVVIDWGLAKDRASPEDDRAPGLTLEGSVMGTPGYMAPEQAAGAEVGASADVYALGAILYHVLAGRPPYDGRSANEVLRQVAAGSPPPIGRIVPGLARELVAIVDKAMARVPDDRYPSAQEMAADLTRFQSGQLVAAHRYSFGQRVVRFLRRNRAPVAVAGVAAVTLAIGGVLGTREILLQRDRARTAQASETARADELVLAHARDLLQRDPTAALAALTSLSPGFSRWGVARTIAADALSRDAPRVLHGEAPLLWELRFTPDGKTLVANSDASAVQRWDVETGELRPLAGHALRVSTLALAEGGATLITGSFDRTVRRWELASGRSQVIATGDDSIVAIAVHPDGSRVIATDRSWTSRVIDLASGLVTATIPGLACFLPGEDELLVLDAQGRMTRGDRVIADLESTAPLFALTSNGGHALYRTDEDLWVVDLATGATQRHEGMYVVATSPDGRSIVFGGRSGVVTILPLDGGAPRHLRGHDTRIESVAWSPDGTSVVTGDDTGAIRVWNVATGAWRELRGHALGVYAFAFSPDGTVLASAGPDATVRLWPVASPTRTTLARPATIHGSDPAGQLVVADDERGALAVIESSTGVSRPLVVSGKLWPGLAPDRRTAVAVEGDPGTLVAIDLEAGTRRELGATAEILALAWTPDSSRFATGHGDGEVRVWSVEPGTPRALARASGAISSLAFSPDGTSLAGTSLAGEVVVWGPDTGEAQVVGRHQARIDAGETYNATLAWSVDSRYLASASFDQTIGVWDAATDAFDTSPRTGVCFTAAFSPDGTQLASCCGPDGIQIRDLGSGTDRYLRGQSSRCGSLRWSDDGGRLVTAVEDGSIRLWDAATGVSREVAVDGVPEAAMFLPDQRRVVAITSEEIVVFDDTLPLDGAALRAAIERAADDRLSRSSGPSAGGPRSSPR